MSVHRVSEGPKWQHIFHKFVLALNLEDFMDEGNSCDQVPLALLDSLNLALFVLEVESSLGHDVHNYVLENIQGSCFADVQRSFEKVVP
jgi:hypothetical protein